MLSKALAFGKNSLKFKVNKFFSDFKLLTGILTPRYFISVEGQFSPLFSNSFRNLPMLKPK